ncbi:AAA family ATPase [Maridesulfovibrio sp.]|uniref:AAA family ATPase n=1 Tax=Maridesulfovibrio sp. TaxID=2795000 RepID=UPI002A18CB15|nr:AAA family ATPase [Maridesulfovibrio sp.]
MLIEKIKLSELLSFPPDSDWIPLDKLNVIIGPNGAGKSNLIEAISLLQSTPEDFTSPIRKGGGAKEWIWKKRNGQRATIEAIIPKENLRYAKNIHYKIEFTESGQRVEITDEKIEEEKPAAGESTPYFYYSIQNGIPIINNNSTTGPRRLERDSVNPEQSILAQRRDPEQYPELTWLGDEFRQIKIYDTWEFGRFTELRRQQPADGKTNFLDEDCLNLGLILNNFRGKPEVKRKVKEYLAKFCPSATDIESIIEGNGVRIFLEEGDLSTPANRLSDGTIRFLCLLAILCHPTPPSLICIEEPEMGLHPDAIVLLKDLLIEASEHTQIIITTHSDILIDALSETPEYVMVCEKAEGKTKIIRLDRLNLKSWLENYSLGDLWINGYLGGTL